ncbi:MAG: MqnA/MqnD/SBP family protein [Leptospira sp.]|nr:MqnA/MqnD/SBP family protein [Leptospira sp.]
MKIGIVKHLNARPLTYYFEKMEGYEAIYDHPSILVELLKESKLDLALISSIECIRNIDTLSFSKSVGVCAKDLVRSVLFYQNKNETFPSDKIYTDSGSRASVALLQCLFHLNFNQMPEVLPTPAAKIESMMENGIGSHLLFGDHALLHNAKPNYKIVDLATWWNQITNTYFCFAFWAYPKDRPILDSIFIQALDYGMAHLDEIIQNETRLPTAIVDRYLKKELHYIPEEKNLKGFELYIETCQKLGLLEKK